MSKEFINSQTKPFLDSYITRLIKELEKRKLLLPVRTEQDFYQVNPKNTRSNSSISPSTKTIFAQLFELRNVAQSVCYNLYPDSTIDRPIPLSRVLVKLEEHNAISIKWKRKPEMLETLDNLDALVIDTDVHGNIEKLVAENNINITKIVNELLEFYGQEKALEFFRGQSFSEFQRNDDKVDLVLRNPESYNSLLLFEFKIRKTGTPFDKKLLLQSLKTISEWTTVGDPKPYLFLIVFTNENILSFEKIKFQFREAIAELKEFSTWRNQVKFIPLAITGLHLIDFAFEDYRKEFIENNIHQILRSQSPPRNFPERNDHFIDKAFEIKKTDFKIIINPGKTKFWRLGFRFTKEEKFPPTAQGRHQDNSVADVHICVGDIESTGDNVWSFENQLTLTHYHAPLIEDKITSLQDYNGQVVTLSVNSNKDASIVDFRVEVDGQSVGYRKFDLHEFNFCKIFAWADYQHFQLDVNILAIRKVNND